jgi:hypothetical protein
MRFQPIVKSISKRALTSMDKFRFFVLLATLLLPASLVAQHGTADNGYYPTLYQGDTWTGLVSSLDPTTKEISLLYTHKQKTVIFSGALAKGYRVLSKGAKEKQQIVSLGITLGARLRVYYIPNQTTDEVGEAAPFKAFSKNLLGESPDAKRRVNLIFLVEFLPDENDSRTGTVLSTNDSTREITLSVTEGAKTENFIGVVVEGYRVKMKDGSFRDLVVSQIPAGAKIMVNYFDEMTGPARTTAEVHRIYRVQFLSLPQTP